MIIMSQTEKEEGEKKELWLQQYKLKLVIKEWVIKSPKTFADMFHRSCLYVDIFSKDMDFTQKIWKC